VYLVFLLKTSQYTLLNFLLLLLNPTFLKGKIRGNGQKNSLAELSSHKIDNYWPCGNRKGRAEKSCSLLLALLLLRCLPTAVLDLCPLQKFSCGMVRSKNAKTSMGSMYRKWRSETTVGKKRGKRSTKITDMDQDAEKRGEKVIASTPRSVGKERRNTTCYRGTLLSYL